MTAGWDMCQLTLLNQFAESRTQLQPHQRSSTIGHMLGSTSHSSTTAPTALPAPTTPALTAPTATVTTVATTATVTSYFL